YVRAVPARYLRSLLQIVLLVLLRTTVGTSRAVRSAGSLRGSGLRTTAHAVVLRGGTVGLRSGLTLADAAEHAPLVRTALGPVAVRPADSRPGVRGTVTIAAPGRVCADLREGTRAEFAARASVQTPATQRVLGGTDVLPVASAPQIVAPARSALGHRATIRHLAAIEAIAHVRAVPVEATVAVLADRRKGPAGRPGRRRAPTTPAAREAL